MRIEVTIAKTSPLPAGAIDALAGELSRRIQYAFPDNEGHVLMNPLMILVKIIKLRW
ncbi:DinI-like family protein, partial [Escherichia coli]|nr:DinI-like family protein [Escherichia coli]